MGIWLKRIAATPLEAIARVIDSLEGGTNDRINAPSIHAVNEGLADKWADIYPVGSIYMNVTNVNPSTLFGGTWVQIKDTFLLACGDTYNNGATGGSATKSYTPAGTVGNHTLTVNEIPFHKHGYSVFESGTSSQAGYTNYKISDGSYNNYCGGNDKTNNMYNENGVLIETTDQGHNHPFTGTAASIDVMPPYLAVNVWKRTA